MEYGTLGHPQDPGRCAGLRRMGARDVPGRRDPPDGAGARLHRRRPRADERRERLDAHLAEVSQRASAALCPLRVDSVRGENPNVAAMLAERLGEKTALVDLTRGPARRLSYRKLRQTVAAFAG